MFLVRGDLEHRIGRGVDDGLAGGDVLLAQARDDLGARGVAVAEHAGQAGLRNQRFQQRRRKTVLRRGEQAERRPQRDARAFPVARRGVLAGRTLAHAAPQAFRRGQRLESGGRCACGQRVRLRQAHAAQVRQPQRPARSRGARRGDMAEGVGTFVAVGRRIRRAAEAEGIQDQPDRARHRPTPPAPRRLRPGARWHRSGSVPG